MSEPAKTAPVLTAALAQELIDHIFWTKRHYNGLCALQAIVKGETVVVPATAPQTGTNPRLDPCQTSGGDVDEPCPMILTER